jgi:hypothetical protein
MNDRVGKMKQEKNINQRREIIWKTKTEKKKPTKKKAHKEKQDGYNSDGGYVPKDLFHMS